jgi:hypothetical protein
MKPTARFLISLLALSIAACGRTPNRAVCCVSQADCDALGVDEPVRNCLDGLICQDNACVPPVCEVDIDCGGETPFCADGACVGCRDASDCSGPTPVCDEGRRTCRACSADADCASNACDFETGACIAASEVIYASPSGTADADCSQQNPCTVLKAVDAANVARSTVRLLPGVYNAALQVDGPISIHGEGATLIASTATALSVVDAGSAHVYDLTIVKKVGSIASQDGYGIFCQSGVNAPKLSLDRVVIDAESDERTRPMAIIDCSMKATQTTLRAPPAGSERYLLLVANSATATFDRSRFIGGGGVAVIDASVAITNSIFERVTGKPTEGAFVTNIGSISVAYSTFFESPLACQLGPVPACSSAARDGVCIENSIVFQPSAATNAINGDKCRCDYCMVTPQQAAVTGTNNTFNGFLSMTDPMNGDFHLVTGSDAIDAAHPTIAGTPDFDGTSRPQGPRSDVGAFEFKK